MVPKIRNKRIICWIKSNSILTMNFQVPNKVRNHLRDKVKCFCVPCLTNALLADLAIDKLFGGFESVLGFLRASLTYTKTFKKVNVKFLELFAQLIITYKRKVVQYADEVVTVRLFFFFLHF